MLLIQPLLTVLLAVTPIYSSPVLHRRDIETRENTHARGLLAKPRFKPRAAAAVSHLKNFQLTNIFTNSFAGVAGDTLNRTISFSWKDVNTNTSTICTTQWQESATNTSMIFQGLPQSYVSCRTNNPDFEAWEWEFSQYSYLGSFQLTLGHDYVDPDVGPPPYDTITVFATYNASLTCTTTSHFEACYVPAAQLPAEATIYGFSA